MSWIVAGSAGVGLGLAYFGGLWLTVQGVMRQPSRAIWVPVGGAARFILLGLALSALCRQGTGSILAALGGLWLARWYIVRRLGGV